ncbi:uncharacterized protein LOC134525560 isoform X3 [Chroicocephalus ridibundus]|uniref:uncharacterized protein LOC134525560 isoform X3 n=1 Tax=Chroicocephalus ridibundus TaxID=1192867 RepID=UPI002FDE05E4
MFSVDFDAECEKEQLLKADEGAGSPTAELTQWNTLFSTNKHRQTSHKPRARGSLMELESEEEPLLNAAANRPATPALPLRAPNPPGEKTEQEEPLAALGEAGYSWEQVEEEPLEKSEIQLQGKVGSSP